MIEISKHFKFLSVIVMVILGVIIMIGWNRTGPQIMNNNDSFPRRIEQQQSGGGIHPNLEPNVKKKPCGACQKKANTAQIVGGRRIHSFEIKKPNLKQKQKFI